MNHPLNIEGWAFTFTEDMLEQLRDSRAHSPAIVLYTESNKAGNRGPFAGDWEVRSTLPSGGPGYVIVLARENIPLRGWLYELAEKLNNDTPYWDWATRSHKTRTFSWPRTPVEEAEGESTPARP